MMKKLFLLCLLLQGSLSAFAQDTKLVKTIDPAGVDAVIMAFAHEGMVAEAWEEPTIRFILEIKTNMPEPIVKQLIKAGRYSMEPVVEGNEMSINMPNLEKVVTIKGIHLEESLSIYAKTPSNFIRNGDRLVKDISTVVALAEKTTGRALSKDVKMNLKKINNKINIEYKIVSDVSVEDFEKMVKSAPRTEVNNRNTEEVRGIAGDRNANKKSLRLKTENGKEVRLNYGDILINSEPFEFE
ncbi:MAG: hypothetical protein MK212_02190 [Saprospiraceae bacterium]|nr:hypothetical protein [Saprospiraceae bacterium]